MLIVDGIDTVVLHMLKCGGISVKQSIVTTYSMVRWNSEHCDINNMPEKYKDFRRIGFVRNPVTWYKSNYYYFKSLFDTGVDSIALVTILSDYYNLSFIDTLPRMLDLQNFFDRNPAYLKRYKIGIIQKLILNHSSIITNNYNDVPNLTADDFASTVYKFWYNKVGLDTADKLYKMDNGRFADYVAKEFPGVILRHDNKTKTGLTPPTVSQKEKEQIATAEEYYMNKHSYDIV